MKYSVIVILSLILIFSISGEVAALSLDLSEDILEFALENKLSDDEIEELRDPFSRRQEPEEEADVADVEDEYEVDIFDSQSLEPAVEPEPEPEEVEEEIREPDFQVDGFVQSADGRVVLIVGSELLRAGESYNDFEFESFRDGEAVFRRDGQEFKLQVGGGV